MNGFVNLLDPSLAKVYTAAQQQTGTDMANNAINAGIQQGQNEHQAIQQAQQAARDQAVAKQTISDLAKMAMYQDQLVNYKQSYADAQKAGDMEGMNQSKEGAAFFRDLMTKDGFNPEGFGVNDTLGQAQARQAYNKTKMLDMAMSNTMSSGTYWNQQYDQYRADGLNDKSARFYADQDAQQYQDKLMGDLKGMLFTSGLGPRGNLTPQGVQIMDMMYGENPESIAYLAQAVPSLVAEYAYQTGQEGKNLDLARNLSVLAANNAYGLQKLGAETQSKAYLMDKGSSNKKSEIAYAANFKGNGGGTTSSSATTKQNKEEYNYLKDWIKSYEEKHKDDEDKSWQNDPDYVNRLERFNSFSAEKYDPSNYRQMASLLTDLIASGRYTKSEIENTMRNMTDMADNLLSNVDWKAWGY